MITKVVSFFLLFLCSLKSVSAGMAPLNVSTSLGTVIGTVTGGVRVWYGLRYAQAPVGKLRWQNPVPATPQVGSPFKAVSIPPGCPQDCSYPGFGCPQFQSEDCLFLNVYAPLTRSTNPKGYPVLFWMHGGSFVTGNGASGLYNGTHFALNGVVVVTINYRLGVLGYLASESASLPGNYGFMDQRLALQWTRDNIASFGGNPSNVTIAGQSAGAMSALCHLVSAKSQGLFSQVVMESNPLGTPYHTRYTAGLNEELVASYLSCASTNITCLRSKTVAQILDAQNNAINVGLSNFIGNILPWGPTVDAGGEIAAQPYNLFREGKFPRLPILVGVNRDEGTLFVYEVISSPVPYPYYGGFLEEVFPHSFLAVDALYPCGLLDCRPVMSQIIADVFFLCPLVSSVKSLQSKSASTFYLYEFAHVLSFDPWGFRTFCVGEVCHGAELPFVFDTFSADGVSFSPSTAEQVLAAGMNNLWSHFVSSVNPNADTATTSTTSFPFHRYSAALNGSVTVLDKNGTLTYNLRRSFCDYWATVSYADIWMLPSPPSTPPTPSPSRSRRRPIPTRSPSLHPSISPTKRPRRPTRVPSNQPKSTKRPTISPTSTRRPTTTRRPANRKESAAISLRGN